MWILMENPFGFPPASRVGGRSFLLRFNVSRREWKASGQKLGFPARKKTGLWKLTRCGNAGKIKEPKRFSPRIHRPGADGHHLKKDDFLSKEWGVPGLLLDFKCPEKCPVLDF